MPDLQLVLRQNYRPFTGGNLVLDGIPAEDTTASVTGEIYWRWEDEPTMEPQFLGTAKSGYTLNCPFDTNGREVRFFMRSRTDNGQYDTVDVKQAVQTTFKVGGVALLSNATFSSSEAHLTIANNGGTGLIRILRRTGTDDFAEIDSVDASTTTYDDSSLVTNGSYDYELMQDGQDGVSNVETITATGLGSSAGSPPDTLAGTHDGIDTVGLTWVNHGGTSTISIERKTATDPWLLIDTVSSVTTSYNDTIVLDSHSHFYSYRVSNASVAGYSNVLGVYVPST